MDRLRKMRNPLRGACTRLQQKLTTELANDPLDNDVLLEDLTKLEKKADELEQVDLEILRTLSNDSAVSDDDYSAEAEGIDEYVEAIISMKCKVRKVLDKENQDANSGCVSVVGSVGNPGTVYHKYRLPKLEIHKFNGEPKEWLTFWSLFKKIDEDISLDAGDKFQYLVQAIVPGSRARDLINSYPPTADNYPKAIESLKQRFGRDDLLVEVYVRELLSLVLQNALNSKDKISLPKLYDKLESYMRALDTLKVTSDKCVSMLFPLVESCLPEDTLRAWQRRSSSYLQMPATASTVPSDRLTKLMEFVRAEVEGEERIQLARSGFGVGAYEGKLRKRKDAEEDIPTAEGLFSGEASNNNSKLLLCAFCDKKHASNECFTAKKMTLMEKKSGLYKAKACLVCLKGGHVSKYCKASVRCELCDGKHYVVMCPDHPKNKVQKPESKSEKASSTPSTSSLTANVSCTSEVGLQTLMIRIGGSSRPVRAIFDSASQRSYILEKTAKELGLRSAGEERVIHSLFGGVKSESQVHQIYEVCLVNLTGTYQYKASLLDQNQICHLIPRVQRAKWFGELRKSGVWLSDVGEDAPEVEILIGADIAGQLLTGSVRQLQCGVTAIETRLGWTLMGKIPGESTHTPKRTSCMFVTTLFACQSEISELWRLETIGIRDSGETKSREMIETAAKEHFLKTVKVNNSGRYEVNLPWIEGHPSLPTNRLVAERRLLTTTKKLIAENKMKDYENVFEEWQKEGIIEVVQTPEESGGVHYLPHRAVIKESSSTTKIRPVFDASAKVKNFPSLNDCLEKGPNLIEKIPSTVMRFREKKIGVVSDIRKAFLQVAVAERDCNHMLFLWWEDYDRRILKIYKHRRVMFGATSSPFLLAAVIDYHLSRVSPQYEPIAKKLGESFYVDNCVTSVSDEEELVRFRTEAQEIMALGKFDLCGWEHSWLKKEKGDPETHVLGMLWDKSHDVLYCNLKGIREMVDGPVTKRTILALANKIYDFVGFSCPVTLLPKLLLQETWKLKVGWDTELSDNISQRFKGWAQDLKFLEELKIPRFLGGNEMKKEKWSLHTFCDASKLAYAACIFLRVERSDKVEVQLVQAKTRVAPCEGKLTIVRLELLSCLIGSRLAELVKRSLRLESLPCFYWTDSSTALGWIKRSESWATFVGNRVCEIRNLSDEKDWRHIPGAFNPADLPSRGCAAKKLVASRWWEGPDWLKRSSEKWPRSKVIWDEEAINQEKRKTVVSMVVVNNKASEQFCRRFSSLIQIIRLIGWILRAGIRKNSREVAELKVWELEQAEKKLWAMVQKESFKSDINKRLNKLLVFTDNDGLCKVKTNVVRRMDVDSFRFPVLLPADHPLVHMLIVEEHIKSCHAGVQTVLTTLREKYWILRGRKTVSSVIRKCVRCRRYDSKNLVSVPAALPEDRVRDASVFEVVGVDLAGPLYLKGRVKSWIVVFTCAVYRAVHFELVTSLSTESFLLALRRFVARRGRPVTVYTDNGTNFIGAQNCFREIDWDEVERFSSAQRIQWRFNPPSAPWWGGWWERMVGLIKRVLRRVLGKVSLTYEALNSVLCDGEAVINARPLTYVSDDANDFVPLSPSVFLQERREVGVPDLDLVNHASLNRKLKHRQELMDHLRKRFRVEYLGQLIQRATSKGDDRPVSVGDVVLVGSDNTKRLDWPLAKVIAILPGHDGNVRVVRLKTATGEFLRPIQRVYPLEVSSPADPVRDVEEAAIPEAYYRTEDNNKVKNPTKVLRTRSGRIIKKPERYSATFSSFIKF